MNIELEIKAILPRGVELVIPAQVQIPDYLVRVIEETLPKIDANSDPGVQLREWRQKNKLSLDKAGELFGVSGAYLSMIESGRRQSSKILPYLTKSRK